jgi:hypothetical protein
MKKAFYLIPLVLIFTLSCARTVPKKEAQIPPKLDNVFNASFNQTWSAILVGLKWMKWAPAFMDEREGVIRLKEAYVYRKSGKLLRIYFWPSKEEAKQSEIDDYLGKVAYYDNSIFDFDKAVLSQENMGIKVISLSKSQTKVEINYKIKPYLNSGKFAGQVKSNGYIESLLLEKIRERLKGQNLSDSSQIYGKISN